MAHRARCPQLRQWLVSRAPELNAANAAQRMAEGVELLELLRSEVKLLPDFSEKDPQFPATRLLMESLFPDGHAHLTENTLREVAGVILGVSGCMITKAASVKKIDHDLFQRVLDGHSTVTAASRVIAGQQEKTPQQDRIEHAAMRRADQAFATMSGTIRAIAIDLPKIRSACSEREIRAIYLESRGIRRALLEFERALGSKSKQSNSDKEYVVA
jgi:hypothetical protein